MIEVVTAEGETIFVDWSPPVDLNAVMEEFEFDGLPDIREVHNENSHSDK